MHSLAEGIGFLSGGIGMTQAWPQARRVRRVGHGHGVSASAWILQYLVSVSWMTYGLLVHSPSMVVTNIVASILTGSVVTALAKNSVRATWWVAASALINVALVLSIPLSVTSVILVALTVSRTPQVLRSWRTLQHGGPSAVSLHALYVGAISLVGWITYALLEHRYLVLLTSSIALVLTLSIATLETMASRRHVVSA